MADRQEKHDGAKMKEWHVFAFEIIFLHVFLNKLLSYKASVFEQDESKIDSRCGKVSFRSTCFAHLGGLSSGFCECFALFKDEATIFFRKSTIYIFVCPRRL